MGLLMEYEKIGEIFLIWFFYSSYFAICCSVVASNKGRSTFIWFLIGFISGIFGFIFSLIVSQDESGVARKAIELGKRKVCQHCAELIRSEAVICRFCGKDQPNLPVEAVIKTEVQLETIFLYAAAIAVVISILVYLVVGFNQVIIRDMVLNVLSLVLICLLAYILIIFLRFLRLCCINRSSSPSC